MAEEQEQPQPNPAHTALLSELAASCKAFSEQLARAGIAAKEYTLLGHAPNGGDPIVAADFAGTLAGRTPAHAAAVVMFVAAIDQLADQDLGNGLTYRKAVLAMARGSR